MDDPQRPSGRVMCSSCARNFGKHLSGAAGPSTKGDKRFFRRLSAAQAHLQWEIMNGQYRSRSIIAPR